MDPPPGGRNRKPAVEVGGGERASDAVPGCEDDECLAAAFLAVAGRTSAPCLGGGEGAGRGEGVAARGARGPPESPPRRATRAFGLSQHLHFQVGP